MRILYLYSEIGPYNIPVFECLTRAYGAGVHVLHWDRNRLKPYVPPSVSHVTYYRRSEYSAEDIYKLTCSIAPDLIYVSGWMDKGYLPTARKFKARGVPVVTGFDDQWHGTLRQRMGMLLFRLHYKNYFSHAWVAGPRQYEFAKRLGFDNGHIIFDMLTCDYGVFDEVGRTLADKRTNYPKSFLYVGNFSAIKGTDILVTGFKRYRNEYGGDWTLICAGNGELRHLMSQEDGIEVKGYLNQTELAALCATSGVFVLPSRHDQWGVVVHEFAAAGLPLLLSESVGAKASFLIENFNGISFANGSSDGLCRAMLAFSRKSDTSLFEMGENSRKLASRITPDTSAASLVSLIPKQQTHRRPS